MRNLGVCIMQNGVSVNGLTATYYTFILCRKSRWLTVSTTTLRLNTMPNISMGKYHAKYFNGHRVLLPGDVRDGRQLSHRTSLML